MLRATALSTALLLLSPGSSQAEAESGPKEGRWREAAHEPAARPELTPEQREMIRQLEAIGYAAGIDAPPAVSRVTRHEEGAAWASANLYTSAHAPEAVLMDMKGNELHRWSFGFRKAWPEHPAGALPEGATYWRRVQLLENGDLVAIFEGRGIIRIDRSSKLVWANPIQAHHDFHVMPDGRVYALTRKAHMLPRVSKERPVLEDFISTLDAKGVEVERLSLLEAMERSPHDRDWASRIFRNGDLLHTNTIVRLEGRIADRIPAFRAGNFLVSMLLLNTIAVVDPELGKVVWEQKGSYRGQHDPQVLANGNLLLFDNRGLNEQSSALEIDPATGQVLWSYRGEEKSPFYSRACGTVQRLPNGNTLITESDRGRAFEVTPKGRIVWEFYNPHRAGESGKYVATLMEMRRLPRDFPLEWVGSDEERPGRP